MKNYCEYSSTAIVNFHKNSLEKNKVEVPFIITRGELASYYFSVLGFEDYVNGNLSEEWLQAKKDLKCLLNLSQEYEFFIINNEKIKITQK